MYNIIKGDILETDFQYIAHQCNCVSSGWSGLAYGIFEKFPYSNIYDERNRGKYVHIPGEIYIRGNGADKRYVINFTGQIYPGYPSDTKFLQFIDSAPNRRKFLYDCLMEIAEIKNLKEIAFPYRVGCGLAGGNWDEYEILLKKFAVYVEKKCGAEVFVLRNEN